MGFSSHEIYMILRARDEATRLVSNVSNALAKTDAGRAMQQVNNIMAVQQAELAAHKERIGRYGVYASEHANGIRRLQLERSEIKRVADLDVEAAKTRIANIEKFGSKHNESLKTIVDAERSRIDSIKSNARQAMLTIDGEINKLKDQSLQINETKMASDRAHKAFMDSQEAEKLKLQEVIDKHDLKMSKLQAVGQASLIAGTGMLIAGGMMVSAYTNAAQAAIDYQQAASLTFTQVDKDAQGHALVTEQAIIDMGKRVAREWPVEFSQIQPAMYDVFSSMDIKSAEIGNKMMDNIAKAAVAGSVEVATAGKGIIEVINAWGLEMGTTAEATATLNRVNDVAFTLVKEGVGSYGQFSDAIGRSIPSAVKAGASYEDMAGGLAFLTRMGLSTTMASTSMGRAFDLIANPRFAANMKKYGLEVADASGNIKPMTEIVNDLQGKMKGMTEVEASKFLKDVTLGAGGTVQAMRFLNHAVHDEAGLFDSLTQSMYDAADAGGTVVGNAYDIMANTPAAKIQELANQFEIFKITVGDVVVQAIQPLVDALTRVLDWFNMLSPEMQNMIIIGGLIAAAFLVIGGIVAILVGGFALMVAAVGSVAAVFTTVLAPIALITVGIMALIAAIVACIVYWPQISAAAQAAWDWIVATWNGLGEWFMGLWNSAVAAVTAWATGAIAAAQTFWNDLVNWFTNIPTMAQAAWDGMIASVTAFFVNAGVAVTTGISVITGMFTDTSNVWTAPFRNTWAIISETTTAVFESIRVIIAGAFLIIVGIFTGDTKLIQDAWNAMGTKLKEIWSNAWDNIKNVIETSNRAVVAAITKLVADVVKWFVDMKTKVGNTLSQWSADIAQKIHEVVTYFQQLPGKVLAAIASLTVSLASQANAWFGSLGAAVSSGIAKVVGFMRELPGKIVSALAGLASEMGSIGTNMMASLAGGIAAAAGRAAQAAINAVKGAIDAAKRLLGIASPSKVFTQFGVYSGEGLAIGFTKMRGVVRDASERMVEAAINSVEIPVTASITAGVPTVGAMSASQLASVVSQNGPGVVVNQEINTQEIDPVKHAADLGYEIGSRLGW